MHPLMSCGIRAILLPASVAGVNNHKARVFQVGYVRARLGRDVDTVKHAARAFLAAQSLSAGNGTFREDLIPHRLYVFAESLGIVARSLRYRWLSVEPVVALLFVEVR